MSKLFNDKSFSILLAEDDTEMRKLLKLHLEKNGFKVFECIDGDSFSKNLSPLNNSGATGLYDLIIADNRMPGLNGLEVLEAVVCCSNCPHVILITAFPDRQTVERAEQMGIVVFSKPFDIDDLIYKIRELLFFE